jgi:hypothetical protein
MMAMSMRTISTVERTVDWISPLRLVAVAGPSSVAEDFSGTTDHEGGA